MSKEHRLKAIETKTPRQTIELGADVARNLRRGDIILLYGELGSGKNVFVKGVCKGLGVKDDVTSSSFVIVSEYQGRLPIVHIDLYRLDAKEIKALPIEEYFLKEGITIVEWADRLINGIKGLVVRITIKDKKNREIAIEDFRD
jgi:tRNA threonylcarbamoyladenosine biosynthesis protein TsaE